MKTLARRLSTAGFHVRSFSYRPTANTLDEHATELAGFVRDGKNPTVHFAGHSMGGLVIMNLLAKQPEVSSGRVVLLGTPLQGSRVADTSLQLPGGKILLGQAVSGLTRGFRGIPENREVGMIAGSMAMGLGLLLGQSASASDGTVALDEADAEGLTDRTVLPVSHTGLLYSSEVARQTAKFFNQGHFSG